MTTVCYLNELKESKLMQNTELERRDKREEENLEKINEEKIIRKIELLKKIVLLNGWLCCFYNLKKLIID